MFIDRAHDVGLKVHCWFQDLATQARLATLPLDGIVTDWPVEPARAQPSGPRLGDLAGGRPRLVALAVLAVSCVLVSDQHFVRGETAVLEAVNGWPAWSGRRSRW